MSWRLALTALKRITGLLAYMEQNRRARATLKTAREVAQRRLRARVLMMR